MKNIEQRRGCVLIIEIGREWIALRSRVVAVRYIIFSVGHIKTASLWNTQKNKSAI
jgi:hypothetical protein